MVADSSKIGQRAFARICPPSQIDTLVTDAQLSDSLAGELTDAGVKVIRA